MYLVLLEILIQFHLSFWWIKSISTVRNMKSLFAATYFFKDDIKSSKKEWVIHVKLKFKSKIKSFLILSVKSTVARFMTPDFWYVG